MRRFLHLHFFVCAYMRAVNANPTLALFLVKGVLDGTPFFLKGVLDGTSFLEKACHYNKMAHWKK